MAQEKFELKVKQTNDILRGDLKWTILTALGYVIGFAFIFLAAFLPGVGDELWRGILFIAGGVLVVGSWVFYGVSASKVRRYATDISESIARANGLSVRKRKKPTYDARFYPAIAEVGRGGRDHFVASGVVSGQNVEVVAHSYGSQHQLFTRTHLVYIKIDFDRLLPHIVLQSRVEKNRTFITALGRTFDDNQRVSLQNNIDSFFLFYTHRRTVTDALAILSPQLLEELMGLDCGLSVETIGKSVYVYVHIPDAEPINLKQNVKFINKIVQSINRSLRVDFLKLPNETKYPYLRSRPTGGVVAFAGKYFNYAAIVLIGQAIWNIFRVFVNKDSDLYESRWWIAGGIIVLTAALIYYLLTQRNKYTKIRDKAGY